MLDLTAISAELRAERKHLRQLRTDRVITQHEGQGQRATYTRAYD